MAKKLTNRERAVCQTLSVLQAAGVSPAPLWLLRDLLVVATSLTGLAAFGFGLDEEGELESGALDRTIERLEERGAVSRADRGPDGAWRLWLESGSGLAAWQPGPAPSPRLAELVAFWPLTDATRSDRYATVGYALNQLRVRRRPVTAARLMDWYERTIDRLAAAERPVVAMVAANLAGRLELANYQGGDHA